MHKMRNVKIQWNNAYLGKEDLRLSNEVIGYIDGIEFPIL